MRKAGLLLLLGWLGLPTGASAASCDGKTYTGTFAQIQDVIFDRHSCSDNLCHGAAQSGGLDLRAGAAYDSLVDVAATTVPAFQRVKAGQKNASLLWVNLAAKTLPAEWHAPLRAMPLDPLPALAANELELVRRWIEGGAPQVGTVPDTENLVDGCLPPPQPVVLKPLPLPENGVQFRIPTTTVPARSEHEICFAQYYDVSDKVPAEYRSPDGTKLRYRRSETRQTPMSHHLVMSVYRGDEPLDSPTWGEFVCWGGAHDGQACDRFDPRACGDGIVCATRPSRSLGCIGVGPSDAGFGVNMMGDGGAGETAADLDFAPGVFDELPLKGMILWNSHAFNLTEQAGDLDAWINFDFAAPAVQQAKIERITNVEQIFKMNAPAFGTDEVCHVQVLPPKAHLFMLSSHTHRRGKRFRIFRGAFRCQAGPHAGEPCSPFGPDFVSPDICGGAACTSTRRPHVTDCDEDGAVGIDEIVRGLNIALGNETMAACPEADSNEDGSVAVDDLLASVSAALEGVPAVLPRDPNESLMYVNLVYNDPLVTYLDPPIVFTSPGSPEADRTLTFCALYDNGYTNPAEVKTRADSPKPPSPAIPGGPCRTPTHCTAGRIGAPCRGANDRLRNASCDSADQAGDGLCDACPSVGGVTTEDEMLVLIGQYYMP